MSKPFRRMVNPEDYFDDAESLRAYSYDASGLSAQPNEIVRPKTIDQLRRIILHANQHHIPLIARGGGTGTRGGAILEGATIVDMRNFATLEKLDRQLQTITVGAGTPIARLNEALKSYGFFLPMKPHSPFSTIGGLAAQNAVSIFSLRYGDMAELILEVECFDGLGRYSTLKGDDIKKVIGKEGTTAIIVKVKIKVASIEDFTLKVIEVEDMTEALAEAQHHAHESLVGVEYCDKIVSEVLGLGHSQHIICMYQGQIGQIRDEEKIKEILNKRDSITQTLWHKDLTAIESVSFDVDNIEKFSNYCQKNNLPCYGHLGIGILFTQLPSIRNREKFYNDVVSLGGIPAGNEGFGRIANNYVPDSIKREVRMLKEERDYNEILNPGVLLQPKKVTQDRREFVTTSVQKAIFFEENDAFLATRDLRISNRHITYLLSKGISSLWLYKVPLYNYLTQDEELIDMRNTMTSRGIETAPNKEMIAKIRAGKNPFQ